MKFKYACMLLPLLLWNCFEYDLTVYVKKDGSGTITRTEIVYLTPVQTDKINQASEEVQNKKKKRSP